MLCFCSPLPYSGLTQQVRILLQFVDHHVRHQVKPASVHQLNTIPVLRIRDVYPGSRISDPAFPDPKTATKENFLSQKISQHWKLFYFGTGEEKIWANLQRIIELLTQKLSLDSQKYGFGIKDPRTGIRKNLFRIPGSKRHHILDTDSQHWFIPDPDFYLSRILDRYRTESKSCFRFDRYC